MLLNPIKARTLFADALQNRYAVLAVNADSPAAITDCLEAAREADAPIIIETSLWQLMGRSFGAGDPILGMAHYIAQIATLASSERYQNVPVIYHTDHIKGPDTLRILKAAIGGIPVDMCGTNVLLRASTVSLDSSELSEEANILTCCDLCRFADEINQPLTLEMEAGVDDGLTPLETTKRLLGSVEEVFPGRIHLWAPGLGTRHGFSSDGYPTFAAENVAAQVTWAHEITGRRIGLALHGSSGLSENALKEAVSAGVVKVNWSSESLLIRSQAAKEFYTTHAGQLQKQHPAFKAYAMDNGVQAFIAGHYLPTVTNRLQLLGSAGQGKRFCKKALGIRQ